MPEGAPVVLFQMRIPWSSRALPLRVGKHILAESHCHASNSYVVPTAFGPEAQRVAPVVLDPIDSDGNGIVAPPALTDVEHLVPALGPNHCCRQHVISLVQCVRDLLWYLLKPLP